MKTCFVGKQLILMQKNTEDGQNKDPLEKGEREGNKGIVVMRTVSQYFHFKVITLQIKLVYNAAWTITALY